jgi:glutamine synthetase
MAKEREKTDKLADAHKQAAAYCDKVKPYFDVIRENIDGLESVVEDGLWPLPKYREMLFLR